MRDETRPTDLTIKTTPKLTGTQQMGSKKEERKRKRRSCHQTKKRLVSTAKEEIRVNKYINGINIFPADLFNTDYNDELKDKET